MKIRTDFVTNSSSSSFIIATKDTALIQSDLVKLAFDDIITTAEELNSYLVDLFYDYNDEYRKELQEELYEESLGYIKKGYTILATEDTSYHVKEYDVITRLIEEHNLDVINWDEL